MRPIDAPMLCDGKILAKVQEQIVTGHGTSRKEVVTHPALFKVVAVMLVRENVDEQLTVWFQEPVSRQNSFIPTSEITSTRS